MADVAAAVEEEDLSEDDLAPEQVSDPWSEGGCVKVLGVDYKVHVCVRRVEPRKDGSFTVAETLCGKSVNWPISERCRVECPVCVAKARRRNAGQPWLDRNDYNELQRGVKARMWASVEESIKRGWLKEIPPYMQKEYEAFMSSSEAPSTPCPSTLRVVQPHEELKGANIPESTEEPEFFEFATVSEPVTVPGSDAQELPSVDEITETDLAALFGVDLADVQSGEVPEVESALPTEVPAPEVSGVVSVGAVQETTVLEEELERAAWATAARVVVRAHTWLELYANTGFVCTACRAYASQEDIDAGAVEPCKG